MSGAAIAAEVAQALAELAGEVGSGTFTVTLVQPSPADTPWGTGGADTETELVALVQNYPRGLIDGTLIQANDRKVMLPATGPKPETTDRLIINSVSHTIVSIRETVPSGVPLYYEVQARS